MHPVNNIRGTASNHLAGRRIVLAVSGSIAAVKTIELARELIRHGAEVHAVMSSAAMGIIHPDALGFATGRPAITKLTGEVEHVQLLGDVPEKADLLLVAPATANTVSKMALGIDDGPVTTCATVAFGTRTPVVVAPAMHEAMMDHPIVSRNARTLIDELGVTWVEPLHEEKKAKLADEQAIVEAVIHRLANDASRPGPLAGKRVLVVSGATAEPVDPVRVLTNRSSGRSGIILATELHRLGADITLWQGRATVTVPPWLRSHTQSYQSHADLSALVADSDLSQFDQVWMPAAINDYAPVPSTQKIASGNAESTLTMQPLDKIITRIRDQAPQATLVAFKAESDPSQLEARARDRLARYGAQYVAANHADAFESDRTEIHLISQQGKPRIFSGDKNEVLRDVVQTVAAGGEPGKPVTVNP